MPTDYAQTTVSFSLTVLSPHPIDDLSPFAASAVLGRADDDILYGIFKARVEDPDDTARNYFLREIVSEALDVLDSSGVSPSELEHEDVRVRAYFTFDPGSETIPADIVRRLARVNATIWVDSNS